MHIITFGAPPLLAPVPSSVTARSP